jgi:hypothetical protein
MSWGGLKTVYVLDDSVRQGIRDLAERYGFRYVVRPNPGEMKKAGNLLHALDISDGDFIAVIDADFAVRREFLYETMPYFSDAKIGIVQTAQYFDVDNRSFSYIQRFNTGCNVDTVAKYIIFFHDDITHMNADTKKYLFFFCSALVILSETLLYINGTSNSISDGGKTHKKGIANHFDFFAIVFLECISHDLIVTGKKFHGEVFILLHLLAVTDDIREHDDRKMCLAF